HLESLQEFEDAGLATDEVGGNPESTRGGLKEDIWGYPLRCRARGQIPLRKGPSIRFLRDQAARQLCRRFGCQNTHNSIFLWGVEDREHTLSNHRGEANLSDGNVAGASELDAISGI